MDNKLYISNYRVKDKAYTRKQRIGNFIDLLKLGLFQKAFLSLWNWNRQFVILLDSERDMIVQIQNRALLSRLNKIMKRYGRIYNLKSEDCGIIVCTLD